MKKILFAACLIFSAAAFSQTQFDNNRNGQYNCQCIGIGIQVHGANNTGKNPNATPRPAIQAGKKTVDIKGDLFRYMQVYVAYMNGLHIRK